MTSPTWLADFLLVIIFLHVHNDNIQLHGASVSITFSVITCCLRNKFNFWNVHRIMNTSGLLQETRSIHDSMNIQKLNLLLIFTFYYKYLKFKKKYF